MSRKQSLDQDQVPVNSPVTDDEQSSIQMTISSWRPVTRKTAFRKRPSPFRRFQVDRLSRPRRSGAATSKNAAKKMERDSEDENNNEQNSGSENDNRLRKNFESYGKNEHLSVQDIINYFESQAEANIDLKTSVRRKSTIAINPEKVSNRRCSGVSSASSQISIDDRNSISAEVCSSGYDYVHKYDSQGQGVQHAHKVDISEDNFKYEKDSRRFDEHGLAISDDVIFSSQGSWSRLQSSTITSSSCYDFDDDVLQSSIERKGVHANNVASGYESDLKMEQYLLAYDNKLRLKSEIMRLPVGNLRKEAESFKDLAKYETTLIDDISLNVNTKSVAADDSFIIPERRGVSDPVLQAHMYVTKDLDQLMTQWNNLRKAEQSVLNDSFIVPARSMSNKRTDTGGKTDLNIEAIESALESSMNNASSVDTKQKDEERTTCYDDWLMMPERSFGRHIAKSERSRIYPLDYEVQLMNDKIFDIHHTPEGKEENSGETMSEQKKLELPALIKAAKTSDPRAALKKDLPKKTSQTAPVRSVKYSIKGAEGTSRAETLISRNSNRLPKNKMEMEKTRKRVEDTRLQRRDRIPAERNSLTSAKAVDALPRASSSRLSSVKPKVVAKPSPSSSNSGKVVFFRGNVSSDSARSTAMNSHLTGRLSIQKQSLTAVNNCTRAVNGKLQRSSSVPCPLEVKKYNDRKPLPGRNKATNITQQSVPSQVKKDNDRKAEPLPGRNKATNTLTQQSVPSQLGKTQAKSAKLGATPRPSGKLSSAERDTSSPGVTKRTL